MLIVQIGWGSPICLASHELYFGEASIHENLQFSIRKSCCFLLKCIFLRCLSLIYAGHNNDTYSPLIIVLSYLSRAWRSMSAKKDFTLLRILQQFGAIRNCRNIQSTSLITTLGGTSTICPYSQSVVIPEVSFYVLGHIHTMQKQLPAKVC